MIVFFFFSLFLCFSTTHPPYEHKSIVATSADSLDVSTTFTFFFFQFYCSRNKRKRRASEYQITVCDLNAGRWNWKAQLKHFFNIMK